MAELKSELPEIYAPNPGLTPPPLAIDSLKAKVEKQLEDLENLQFQSAIAQDLETNLPGMIEEENKNKQLSDAYEASIAGFNFKDIIKVAVSELTAKGLVLIPFQDHQKIPKIPWKNVTQTPDITMFDTCNIAISCGPSNIIAVDIDTADNGMDAWRKIVDVLDISEVVDRAPMEITTTGGIHYYFKGSCSTNAKQIICKDENGEQQTLGIDSRSVGGVIRCAPSKHVPGKKSLYPHIFWVRSILGYELPECPKTLVDLLNKEAQLKIVDGRFEYIPAKAPVAPEDSWMELSVDEKQQFEGEKIELTIEQIGALLNCLKDSSIDGHDSRAKLIWIVARWSKKNGKPSQAIRTIKKFLSERCPTSKMNEDERFDKAWDDGLARDDGKTVNVGTLRHMAKKDNPEEYNKIFPPKPVEVNEPMQVFNTFTRDDNFYWGDFVRYMTSKVFESKGAMRKELKTYLPRVFALISIGKGIVVKKDNPQDLFSILNFNDMDGVNNFTMKYWSETKDDGESREHNGKKQYHKLVKFFSFIKENVNEYIGFNRADVYPGGNPPPGTFNLWVGFQAKRTMLDMTKLQPLFDVLYYGWAGSNPAIFKRIITFLAMTIKEPQKKIGNALVLYGIGGDGKGSVCKFLANYVLGKQLCVLEANLEGLFGKQYNAKLRGKKLLMVNECEADDKSARSKKLLNILKNAIDADTLNVSEKYQAERDVNDFSNFILCTNHKDALPIEPIGADGRETAMSRRLTFIDVKRHTFGEVEEHKIKERWAWFAGTYLESQEIADHFYTFLVDLPKSEWDQNMNASLRTELTDDIAEISKESWQEFIDEICLKPDMMNPNDEKADYQAKVLFDRYVSWCQGRLKPVGSKTFYMNVAKLCDGQKACKIKGVMHYRFTQYRDRIVAQAKASE